MTILDEEDDSARLLRFKVIIEKSRGGIFSWNRDWDLGWIWADWQYWKKGSRLDYEQLLKVFFSCFQEQRKMLNFHKKRCSVRIKKLHKMKLTRFFFLKKLNLFFYFIKKRFQLCLAPHRGTYLQWICLD